MKLLKRLSYFLDFAAEKQDDAFIRREKRILAGMLYIATMSAPLIVMMIALSGQGWVALFTAAISTLPHGVCYLIYRLTHNLRVSKLLFLYIICVTASLPLLAGGGPSNFGYFSYFIAIPMIWLFLTFNYFQTILLELLAIGISVTAAAVQDHWYHIVVEQWSFSTHLSITWVKWLWVFHIAVVNVGYLLCTFILVHDLNGQIKSHEETERRLVELSEKLIELDIDDISHPGENASELEKRVYEIVEHIRLWKPYIPQTLFMKDNLEPFQGGSVASSGLTKTETRNEGADTKKYVSLTPLRRETSPREMKAIPPLLNLPSSRNSVTSSRGVDYTISSAIHDYTLQMKCITFVAFHRKNSDKQTAGNKNQIEESLSLVIDVIHNFTSVQKGAIHQCLGDLITCVWSGANHQIRACRAVLQIMKQLNSQEKITVVAGMTSGNMLVGTLGRMTRLPVFYGEMQEVGYRLLCLCDVLQGEVIIDSSIHVQVEHEFLTVPVDIIYVESAVNGTCMVYELFGEKSQPSSSTEWMYELAESTRDQVDEVSSNHKYLTAFNAFMQGQFSQAQQIFQALLQSMDTSGLHGSTPVQVLPLSSSTQQLPDFFEFPVLRRHVRRLVTLSQSLANTVASGKEIKSTLRPVRQVIRVWEKQYTLSDGVGSPNRQREKLRCQLDTVANSKANPNSSSCSTFEKLETKVGQRIGHEEAETMQEAETILAVLSLNRNNRECSE